VTSRKGKQKTGDRGEFEAHYISSSLCIFGEKKETTHSVQKQF
jgi:hypothetical protein